MFRFWTPSAALTSFRGSGLFLLKPQQSKTSTDKLYRSFAEELKQARQACGLCLRDEIADVLARTMPQREPAYGVSGFGPRLCELPFGCSQESLLRWLGNPSRSDPLASGPRTLFRAIRGGRVFLDSLTPVVAVWYSRIERVPTALCCFPRGIVEDFEFMDASERVPGGTRIAVV